MIETRVIADEIFIVSHEGRREVLSTPTEAIAAARVRVSEHEATLRKYGDQSDTLTREIEHAAFFGEPTNELRQGLQDIQRQSTRVRSAIAGELDQIEAIRAAVQQHQAARLAREHAGHLYRLTEPFNKILQECRV